MKIKLVYTLLLLLLLILICRISRATDYYISTSGSTGGAGTEADPWRNISQANSTLVAGETVYIKAGTYSEGCSPANSGAAGNYITYVRFGTDVVTLTSSSIINSRSYIVIDGFRIRNSSGTWINGRPSSHHNIIQNCEFSAGGAYQGIMLREGADYNQILNNTFTGICNPDDSISLWGGSYNLIEGNDFSYSPHVALNLQARYTAAGPTQYNIVRNNTFRNLYHTAVAVARGTDMYTLVEGNTFFDSGEEYLSNSCGSATDIRQRDLIHRGVQFNGGYNIFRKNVLINNSPGTSITSKEGLVGGASYNHVYHNTYYENIGGHQSSSGTAYDDCVGNVFKNNIFYNNDGMELDYEIWMGGGAASGNSFINNNVLGASTNYASNTVTGGLSVNPRFVSQVAAPNLSDSDLHLDEGYPSPMIDAGAWLTTITSDTGSGTSFAVDDSLYFMDGWGLITGDTIKLEGQGSTRTITNVNYSTDTITISSSVSWTVGDGVALPYNGTAPDIGAYESGAAPSPDTEAPIKVTDLNALVISSTQVDIWWAPSTDDTAVTGYYVYLDFALDKDITVGTSTSVVGLTPDTAYRFEVSAYDAAGNESLLSDPVIKTTDAGVGGSSLSVRVLASSDDAEEEVGDGTVRITSSDLELIYDPDEPINDDQIIGLRFQNIQIPQGDTITSSSLDLQVDEINVDACSLTFYCEYINTAPTFTTGTSNISNRTKTTASVVWPSVPTWPTVGEIKSSPDLSPIIQEVINHASWAAGNDIVIIIEGTTGQTRIAESYDGSVGGAPLLDVVFTTAVTDTTPPSIPTGITVTVVNSEDLHVTWTSSTDNIAVTYYEIYRDDVLIGTQTDATKTSFTDPTFLADATYEYKVLAGDEADNTSAKSVGASATLNILKIRGLSINRRR